MTVVLILIPKGSLQRRHPGLPRLLGGGVFGMDRGRSRLRTGGEEEQRRTLRPGRERGVLGSGLERVLLQRVAQEPQYRDHGDSQVLHNWGLPRSTCRHPKFLRRGWGEGGRGEHGGEGGQTFAAGQELLQGEDVTGFLGGEPLALSDHKEGGIEDGINISKS